ncbi:MAG: acetate--CoA ligase family protein [Sphingobium sp.]
MPDDSTSTRDLSALLDPKSIAIIGASPNPLRIGGIPLANLLARGFPADRILPVNPNHGEIQGLRCYADIDALPWAPDLAIVAVAADAALDALDALDRLGARAAILFAAGFGEDPTPEGLARDAKLKAFIAGSAMAIAGPNTIGIGNIATGTTASFLTTLGEPLPAGPLALIGQSGNSVSMMASDARDFGIGMSYFVSTGNEAGVDFAAYLDHFAADPATGAVLGYCEQVRDGAAFMNAALRLRDAGKPLFLTKVGRSEKGREATISHTGAMAGDAIVTQAAFRQLGIGMGRDPAEVMDLARLWNTGARPVRPGVCIVSLSGAGCAFLSDMFDDAGVPVPTLPDTVQARLRTAIPSYGMVSNPVDLTGNVINDMNHLRTVLDALIESDAIDCILIYIMGSLLDAAAPILLEIRQRTDKLIVALDPSHARSATSLRAAGVEVFADALRAVSGIAAYLRWAQDMSDGQWRPAARRAIAPPDWLEGLHAGGRRSLTEVEGKKWLAEAGIPTVDEVEAADEAAALAAAEALGYPVVVKLSSPDVAHKTEIGGVALDIRDASQLRTAFRSIIARATAERPDAEIRGVAVQKQLAGQDMLIGITRDPTFGPVMTLGLGGVLTELYRDIAVRLLPVDRRTARAMLEELTCAPLLTGFRGRPMADIDALADAMAALSDLALASPHIAELEVNPMIVRPAGEGCFAVDALVLLAD